MSMPDEAGIVGAKRTVYSVGTSPVIAGLGAAGVRCAVHLLSNGSPANDEHAKDHVSKQRWSRCPTSERFFGKAKVGGGVTLKYGGHAGTKGYSKGYTQYITAECIVLIATEDTQNQLTSFPVADHGVVVIGKSKRPRRTPKGRKALEAVSPADMFDEVNARLRLDNIPDTLRGSVVALLRQKYGVGFGISAGGADYVDILADEFTKLGQDDQKVRDVCCESDMGCILVFSV
jgi:hypothetical protein